LNYGLKDYLWSVCKPGGTVKWGETRWAVGYPGVTWGSAVGPLNPDRIGATIYGLFNVGYESFRSDHAGGVNFTFVDGSVRFLADEIDLKTLKALSSRAGDEVVDTSNL
jgi:prepilin-type processing-associated H-X9-DG protein